MLRSVQRPSRSVQTGRPLSHHIPPRRGMVRIRTVGPMNEPTVAIDEPVDLLEGAALHLGLDATATPMPDFSWDPAALAAYVERFDGDGDEGRLVVMFDSAESWTSWERHPVGEEVVVLVSGRMDLLQ